MRREQLPAPHHSPPCHATPRHATPRHAVAQGGAVLCGAVVTYPEPFGPQHGREQAELQHEHQEQEQLSCGGEAGEPHGTRPLGSARARHSPPAGTVLPGTAPGPSGHAPCPRAPAAGGWTLPGCS